MAAGVPWRPSRQTPSLRWNERSTAARVSVERTIPADLAFRGDHVHHSSLGPRAPPAGRRVRLPGSWLGQVEPRSDRLREAAGADRRTITAGDRLGRHPDRDPGRDRAHARGASSDRQPAAHRLDAGRDVHRTASLRVQLGEHHRAHAGGSGVRTARLRDQPAVHRRAGGARHRRRQPLVGGRVAPPACAGELAKATASSRRNYQYAGSSPAAAPQLQAGTVRPSRTLPHSGQRTRSSPSRARFQVLAWNADPSCPCNISADAWR